MSELVSLEAQDLEHQGIKFEESKLVISEGTTFERWLSLGQALQQMDRSIKWWVGDWLIFGETRAWGEKYPQAIQEATGYHYDSLRKAAFVSERIESVRRRTDLKWSHHDAVATLEPAEQEEILTKAAEEGWTVEQTREAAREVRMLPDAARKLKGGEVEEEELRSMRLCPHCNGEGVIAVENKRRRK